MEEQQTRPEKPDDTALEAVEVPEPPPGPQQIVEEDQQAG